MNKNQDLIRFLQKNKQVLLHGDANNGICYDGIVNEAQYNQQTLKVAVLLKETNGSDSSGDTTVSKKDWLYIQWIRHQQAEGEPEICVDRQGNSYVNFTPFYSSTYRKLCLWLSILFDMHDKKEFSGQNDLEGYFSDGSVNVDMVRKSLHRVAIMNLKKTWGDASTDGEQLRAYATDEHIASVLKKQLEEYIAPDIVLCCSEDVFKIATELFDGEIKTSDQKDLFQQPYQMSVCGKIVFVKMYHPTYQGGRTDKAFAGYAKELFSWVLEEVRKLNKK